MSRANGSEDTDRRAAPRARDGLANELVWFRRDLRLGDNPAWEPALSARGVTALYVIDPVLFDGAGPFRGPLLLAHLHALDASLRELGGRLRVERGDPVDVVPRVARSLGAAVVRWNGDATPYARRRDASVHSALGEIDLASEETWGTMVHRPGTVLTRSGSVSLVFTPFSKAWNATPWEPWPTFDGDATAVIADDPGIGVPALDGDPPERAGEAAALDRLAEFASRADRYLDERDIPALEGTSELSAHLRFGTLSPRRAAEVVGDGTPGRAGFVRQLAWRDWYAHLLVEHPHLRTRPLKPEVGEIRWLEDAAGFAAWTEGRTGYPIVDAGMRELAATGRMHNRVRMICASFLVKDLLIDWRRGERWFRDLLVDGDVAQNVGNWQWTAGTGPDAAPYFRVFNPTTQSRKFDPDGTYVRRWVPELAGLDATQIHEPAAVGPIELAAAGVVLGQDYPAPIVDHSSARDRALAAYDAARTAS